MNTLAPGIGYFDVQFLGIPQVIATGVIVGPGGVALVDPGPASSLPGLEAGLKSAGITWRDVTTLLITHIHLDHSGACGTLLRDHPALRIYVHELGAPHLVNPDKLWASAARLYGADMDRLWGEVLPVPGNSLTVLRGGERLDEGGRTLEVAYTPGHASHHVSYFVRDAGIAFVGDTAGVKIPGGDVVPPTPPPDIDLEAWRESLARIGQWHADTVFLTHFGPVSPVDPHLSVLRDRIEVTGRMVKESLDREGTDESREAWFVEESRRALRRTMNEVDAKRYEAAGRFDLNWRGLARYWRKKVRSLKSEV
jgi:glyoxylase-like metal-dependent hydrolase (beta-lactamase superfamily II)